MRAAALVALAVSVGAAGAQTESGGVVTACRLPVHVGTAGGATGWDGGHARTWASPTCDPATEGTRIEVEYTGFPEAATAAFQRAVDVWACRVRSDQTVRVAATWAPLGPGTLGSAGPALFRNFPRAPARGVWYPAAVADHLAGRDLGDGAPDVEATFNSLFPNWHFGPEPPAEGDYDLATVVLHELAHGLGFIGSLTVVEGAGRVGVDPEGPFSFDLFTRADTGGPLLDVGAFPDGSSALASALQRTVTFGGRATARAGGGPAALYAPSRWAPGASYAHLDERTYPEGTPDGLMTPFIARGEQVSAPGATVCGVLADVGWDLAGDCARAVGPLPPVGAGVAVQRLGANPFSDRTTLRVHVEGAAVLRADVVDARGRNVTAGWDRAVAPGQPWDIEVDASGLAAGVYFVVVQGGPEAAVVPLTVAR